MKVQVECAWGEGPDVMIVVEHESAKEPWGLYAWGPIGDVNGCRVSVSTPEDRLHVAGLVKASVGITADEARKLAAQLLVAADRADELENSYFEATREAIREKFAEEDDNVR
jgi:hypothetical protein